MEHKKTGLKYISVPNRIRSPLEERFCGVRRSEGRMPSVWKKIERKNFVIVAQSIVWCTIFNQYNLLVD